MRNFIEPYNREWKTEYESLKNILIRELEGFEIDVQHVGSTSIPGLWAKPILDIDLILTEKEQIGGITERLERLGYKPKGEQGIAGRFAFRQTSDLTPSSGASVKWQEHHLYVCFSDSLALKNHLLFRDTLLQDRKLADEYLSLKINLTTEKGMTRENYTKQKTDFILAVLAQNGLTEKELNEIKNANI